MLTVIPQTVTIPQPQDVPYDLERVLPIEMIRLHTKTDDVPSVTDEQLEFYRLAALQAAEEYTGFMLIKRQTITEPVVFPNSEPRQFYHPWLDTNHKNIFVFTTKYRIAKAPVYFFGHGQVQPIMLDVNVGTRRVLLPRAYRPVRFNDCNGGQDGYLMYVAGFADEKEIPAAIALGALKYIAHVMENPGDNVVVTSARGIDRSDTPASSSIPAVASGAIEIWRAAIKDAI